MTRQHTYKLKPKHIITAQQLQLHDRMVPPVNALAKIYFSLNHHGTGNRISSRYRTRIWKKREHMGRKGVHLMMRDFKVKLELSKWSHRVLPKPSSALTTGLKKKYPPPPGGRGPLAKILTDVQTINIIKTISKESWPERQLNKQNYFTNITYQKV